MGKRESKKVDGGHQQLGAIDEFRGEEWHLLISY